jgi:hypothetical protein
MEDLSRTELVDSYQFDQYVPTLRQIGFSSEQATFITKIFVRASQESEVNREIVRSDGMRVKGMLPFLGSFDDISFEGERITFQSPLKVCGHMGDFELISITFGTLYSAGSITNINRIILSMKSYNPVIHGPFNLAYFDSNLSWNISRGVFFLSDEYGFYENDRRWYLRTSLKVARRVIMQSAAALLYEELRLTESERITLTGQLREVAYWESVKYSLIAWVSRVLKQKG